jgi:hypothetical protein
LISVSAIGTFESKRRKGKRGSNVHRGHTKAPLKCMCKGAKDCLDFELSERCRGHVIAVETYMIAVMKRKGRSNNKM